MKYCQNCLAGEKGMRMTNPNLDLGEVKLLGKKHIAYKLVPALPYYQTICGIELDKQFREDRIQWRTKIIPRDPRCIDEASIRKPDKTVKELLCYLKFGKCDPKTLEIYEKLKDPQGDD